VSDDRRITPRDALIEVHQREVELHDLLNYEDQRWSIDFQCAYEVTSGVLLGEVAEERSLRQRFELDEWQRARTRIRQHLVRRQLEREGLLPVQEPHEIP